jgi:hypothetical protein
MALEPDAVLSETDFRTYNLIKGQQSPLDQASPRNS